MVLKNSLKILYGSETGQAKSIAENIFTLLNKFSFSEVSLHCLNEVDKTFFLEKLHFLVIVCSTTGDGDPPDNAQKFVRKINRRSLNNDLLSHTHYTLLGLGDSNYSNFCNCGKTIDKRMKALGAVNFYQSAFADDAVGLELVVEPWLDGLLPALMNHFSITELNSDKSSFILFEQMNTNSLSEQLENLSINSSLPSSLLLGDDSLNDKEITIPKSKAIEFDVNFQEQKAKEEAWIPPVNCSPTAYPAMASNCIYRAHLLRRSRITSEDAIKHVYLTSFGLEDATESFSFVPGDSISILPMNNSNEVERILQFVNVNSHSIDNQITFIKQKTSSLTITKAVPSHLFSCCSAVEILDDEKIILPTSLRQLLLYACDLRQCPSKMALRNWAEFCSSSIERRRMLELCSKEGQKMYNQFIREARLSLLDLLLWFPSCRLPTAVLLSFLPRLLPRPYSLLNSPLDKEIRLQSNICSVDVAYSQLTIRNKDEKGLQKYDREGVCTGWLNEISLTNNKPVDIYLYKRRNLNGFHLPVEFHQPLILIAAGTGLAPFIGFLRHRKHQYEIDQSLPRQTIWLFFGCRNRNKDFLFKQELLQLHTDDGVLSHLCVAFSREEQQEEGEEKGEKGETENEKTFHHLPDSRYVMDSMKSHAIELRSMLLHDKATVMLCGDANGLAKSVADCFLQILSMSDEISNDGSSAEEAVALLKNMRIEKRYVEDIWG